MSFGGRTIERNTFRFAPFAQQYVFLFLKPIGLFWIGAIVGLLLLLLGMSVSGQSSGWRGESDDCLLSGQWRDISRQDMRVEPRTSHRAARWHLQSMLL